MAAAKAKILRKLSSQDVQPFEQKSVVIRKNKENINLEKAAAVIQNRKFISFKKKKKFSSLTLIIL